jgi:tRNA uridine 5-carbamoylmethylation protein Kti12
MTQRALLICFTGIDGSGKTTQAKLLDRLVGSKGVKSIYVWSRGEVLTIRRYFFPWEGRALGTSAREIAMIKILMSEYQSRKSRLMGNLLVRMLWSVYDLCRAYCPD